MNLAEFQAMPVKEAAALVRQHGPKVCVFPINGTRRWFLLEHAPGETEDFGQAYLDAAIPAHIALYKLIFEHGIDTLITPVFGPDLLERGTEYTALAVQGLSSIAAHPTFLRFYDELDVRVRFYGDYGKYLNAPEYLPLIQQFAKLTEQTSGHRTNRLLFGLFAHDATETVAELAVRYYLQHGKVPDTRMLIELYYGEYVKPVDIFVGFDKPSVFDMPLIADGTQDLYFTISPSLYLTEEQFRTILYDHLYARSNDHTGYDAMTAKDWAFMKAFYQANVGKTIGVGATQAGAGIWYPLPQVSLPTTFPHAQSSPQDTIRS